MTSLTFDTTEVFILSANSAVSSGSAPDLSAEFTTLAACCAAAFLLPAPAFAAGLVTPSLTLPFTLSFTLSLTAIRCSSRRNGALPFVVQQAPPVRWRAIVKPG
ncbi:hypothetical protein [Massilia sp. TWR1-2-2]|uniref:hypothetical protein n=1 Tax=Massilia sp. TWR1-2-2 TaxID=2804584 RepID=UPI003CE6D5F3